MGGGGSGDVLDAFRVGAGHQREQAMTRRMGLSSPPSSSLKGKGNVD